VIGSEPSPPDWDELAPEGLAGVLDPADAAGGKNRLIDRAQKRAIVKHGGSVRGRQVLDFGCGNGRLSGWLVARGATVHGVDTSPEMVAQSRKQVPEASFEVLDPERVQLGSRSYDLVLSAGVLCFLPEMQLTKSLAAMRESLRPGGRIVALEKVSDGTPGLGWTLEQYRRCFVQAHLELREPRVVRLGFSGVLGFTARRPYFARLPILPAILELEARRHVGKGFADGQYADYLFIAKSGATTPTSPLEQEI